MRTIFVIADAGVAHKPMGEIDMRGIALTLATIMDVKLPSATGRPLF